MADRREGSTRSSNTELSRRERSILRGIAQAMGLGEAMAALMVVATGLSAYATWRTASIANAIYHVGDRPYLGVQDLRLDRTAGKNPRILVEYRNLGDVQAYDVVITKDLMIDDHPVAADTRTLNIGIDSPKVPHFFALELSPQSYEAIVAGRSTATVQVNAKYSGPDGGVHCYLERFRYDKDTATFEPIGGTPRCEDRQE